MCVVIYSCKTILAYKIVTVSMSIFSKYDIQLTVLILNDRRFLVTPCDELSEMRLLRMDQVAL